jgi:hypothetical protein
MGGGAWPFLVGGVICLVDSDNERDGGSLLVYLEIIYVISNFFTRQLFFKERKHPAITGL